MAERISFLTRFRWSYKEKSEQSDNCNSSRVAILGQLRKICFVKETVAGQKMLCCRTQKQYGIAFNRNGNDKYAKGEMYAISTSKFNL